MKFAKMLRSNKFTLVVSLPENRLELAQAALEGGAQAIKVHVNVWHRASGHTFGTFSENRNFLKELVSLCGEVPAGLVLGGEDAFVSIGERDEMEELGIDFFSSYSHHLPCYMMDAKRLDKMVAIDSSYNQNTLDGINRTGIDVLECSIQPGEAYGQKLNFSDVIRYADISAKVKVPALVPTQKYMEPEDVRHLYNAGCKAVMMGAIVMGKEPDAESVWRAVSSFAAVVKAL